MADIGYGGKFYINDGASNAYQEVANLKSVDPAELTVDDVEVTALGQSTAVKQYTPGLRDGGELSVEGYWNEEVYERLAGLDGVTKSYRIEYQGIRYTWSGYLHKLKIGQITAPDVVMYTFAVKVNDEVTIGVVS